MTDIAKLGLEVDSSGLKSGERGMKSFQHQSSKTAAAVERTRRTIKRLAAAAVVLGGAYAAFKAVSLIKETLAVQDATAKLSAQIGVSTEKIAGLQLAASQGGVSNGSFNSALIRLARSASDANDGLMTQSRAFKKLEISVTDNEDKLKSTDVLLGEIADKFSTMTNVTQKAAIAQQLLGGAGARLVPTLNGGSAALERYNRLAKDLGITVDGKTSKSVENFNDNMSTMGLVTKGVANQFVNGLAPALEDITQKAIKFIHSAKWKAFLEKAAEAGKQFGQRLVYIYENLDKVAAVAKTVGKVLLAAFGIRMLGNLARSITSLGTMVISLTAVETRAKAIAAIRTLANPFMLATAAVVGLGIGIVKVVKYINDVKGAMADLTIATGKAAHGAYLAVVQFAKLKNAASLIATTDALNKEIEARDKLKTKIADINTELANHKWYDGNIVALKQQRKAVGGLEDDLITANGHIRRVSEQIAKISLEGVKPDEVEQTTVAVAGLADVIPEVTAATTAATEALSAYDDLMAQISDRTQGYQDDINGLTQAQSQYRDEVQQLGMLFAGGDIGIGQMVAGIAAATEALSSAGQAEGMSALVAMYDSAHDSLIDTKAALAGASREQIAFNRTQRDADAALKKAGYSMKAVAQHAKVMGEAVKKSAAEADLDKAFNLESLMQQWEQKSPFEKMTEDAKTFGDALEKALAKGDGPEAKRLQENLDRVRDTMKVAFIDTAQQAIMGIRSLTQEGSKSYKALTIAGGALAVVKGVIAVINAATEGDGYTAVARMAAVAAAVGPLLASIGQTMASIGGGGGFSDTAASRQASQGTGSVLGDSEAQSKSIIKATEITASATEKLVGLNRGILNTLQALQAGIGSAGGMLARGAGEADFSGMGLAMKHSALGKLVGGKSKVTDEGIKIVGGALTDMIENVSIGAYQEVKSKSWWFGSTKTKEGFKPVSDQFSNQFQLIIGAIADTVREGAIALGILPAEVEAAINAYQIATQNISLKGLSAEEQQAELQAVFSSIFDGLAGSVVPFIEQFQKVGEGLGETLVRVATEVQVMQEAIKQLGFAADTTDPEKFAQIADGLIEMAGGTEAFISGMTAFTSKFATDSHKFTVAQDAINSAFEQAGLTVPASADAMWGLMTSLDASTEAGREQIATLLRLAEVSGQYYDLLDKRTKAQFDYAMLSAGLAAEAGTGSQLSADLLGIAQWSQDTTKKLNDLAIAAGRAGASEHDLALVHVIAAQRAKAAIAALMEASADLVSQLYGGGATEAMTGFGNAIQGAAQKAKDGIDLLLGDLSPFSDRKKLEMALQGQQAGTVTPEQVLTIGRRLMASGADYKALFDQVMAVGDKTGGGDAGRTATATTEIAHKTLTKAERYGMADQLANNIADVFDAQRRMGLDTSFQAIADELGLNLSDLGKDLGLDNTALQDYLSVLASDNFGFSDLSGLLSDQIDRLIAAITGQAYDPSGTTYPLGEANQSAPDGGVATRNPVTVTIADDRPLRSDPDLVAKLTELSDRTDAQAKMLAELLSEIRNNTGDTAAATSDSARLQRDQANDPGQRDRRPVRVPSL